jgi:hypothetical protein
MTTVGAKSGARYGDGALLHGVNMAFLSMAAFTLILLLISVFGVRQRKMDAGQA